jgi:uncharacterized protein
MRIASRRRGALLASLLLLLVIVDLRQPAADQWSARAAVLAIHGYQATLSRWFAASGVRCRFTLSCSEYAEACIERFGAARGAWLALTRVVRCGPWTPAGTVDPPPTAL